MNISSLPELFDNILRAQVIDYKCADNGYYLKAVIFFRDETVLHVRELVALVGRDYSFHWQREDGGLIKRWDNAPYHKGAATFPHHVHENDTVHDSFDITLEDVLTRIKKTTV